MTIVGLINILHDLEHHEMFEDQDQSFDMTEIEMINFIKVLYRELDNDPTYKYTGDHRPQRRREQKNDNRKN